MNCRVAHIKLDPRLSGIYTSSYLYNGSYRSFIKYYGPPCIYRYVHFRPANFDGTPFQNCETPPQSTGLVMDAITFMFLMMQIR